MRDVNMSVGGKGANLGTQQPEVNPNTFDAIVERGKVYAAKLDNSEGILYEAPTAKDLNFVVYEQDAVYDPVSKTKISTRKSVRVRFQNGFYLLDKNDKNFRMILTFLEGDEMNPPHHMFGRMFWRVEEAARNLRKKALDQAVQLVVNSKDPNLAQSLIARLQETLNVQIAPAEEVPQEPQGGGKPTDKGQSTRGRAARGA